VGDAELGKRAANLGELGLVHLAVVGDEVTLELSPASAALLRQRASEKGLAAATLAAALLELIIQDKLYDAVLDGRDILTPHAA